MHHAPGRNDPCPCGSGKKYKHCHLHLDAAPPATAAPTDSAAHEGAVEAALDWLTVRHRKGFKTAVEALFDEWCPEDSLSDRNDLDADTSQAVQINLIEWLLAEGEMQVKGEHCRVNELLVGPQGPPLTEGQRAWLLQLGQRPLQLYTVTDVRPGEGLNLCEALDATALPLAVQERAGSRSLRPGMLLGARVMDVGGHRELSGAVYPFSLLAKDGVLAAVQTVDASGLHPETLRTLRSQAIGRAWLRQFLLPPPLPKMVDASTGEPLLLVTDHYRVLDAAALAAALAACADVNGNAQQGWLREAEGDDGAMRIRAAINPGRQPDRIEIFYRTQGHADAGRAWFDAVAGTAVTHLTREAVDPEAALRSRSSSHAAAAPPPMPMTTEAMEQILRQHYARWADEQIPALDGQTPRLAITTPPGLERVKGLLRSYESGEAEMAARDGRRAVSYRFLWDTLGIAP